MTRLVLLGICLLQIENKRKSRNSEKIQEALLLQRNRATRYVSSNIMAVF